MSAYYIHISGMVQGVGFRPFIHKLAVQLNIDGWVSNNMDGVHIVCSGSEENIHSFQEQIFKQPPVLAVITQHTLKEYTDPVSTGFYIKASESGTSMQMLITPDITICDDCRRELYDKSNKRFHYPFITCVNCGPRYSITTAMPYDRQHTTMNQLHQCVSCKEEYADVNNSRHHSQTNSCPSCAIQTHLYDNKGHEIQAIGEDCLNWINNFLAAGKIIAVKGTGGYLLICDATRQDSIRLLRERKKRPSKPFALLYADLEMVYADTAIKPVEVAALKERSAPIVLCKLKKFSDNRICAAEIAPGLTSIGVMLPSTPLLELIAHQFGKPLVATSANVSGSPIIYEDAQALMWLPAIADIILTYDRKIVAPQDDSVIKFSERGQKIILRRSRGLAPNYYPLPLQKLPDDCLAMGAELKGAFAISHEHHLFISQYLGDQQFVESQKSFQDTLEQVSSLLNFKPKLVLTDKHPSYYVSNHGASIASSNDCKLVGVQHHVAHFSAVMAENNLLYSKEPVLGIICDGAGYGDDAQIWGGEIFIFDENEIKRVAHLAYFPQLLGDKMNKEPRLSALSILKNFANAQNLLQKYFNETEWKYYTQLLQQPPTLMTSSMGRLIDAVACLLGIKPVSSYEGEAAMQLEALASSCTYPSYDSYHLPLIDGVLDWKPMMHELIEDWYQKEPNNIIAWKFFYSLAKAFAKISSHFYIDKVAFSGGVFQNTLLVDMVIELMQHKRHLYFHKMVSPNDECISFGQIAWYGKFGKAYPAELINEKLVTQNNHQVSEKYSYTN